MVPAYLSSLLVARLRELGPQDFVAKYPHAWLVWEPGEWTAPDLLRLTRDPVTMAGAVDERGEALCYALKDGASISMGRAEKCDLVVNDATVSREHLTLAFVAGAWTVTRAQNAKRLMVAGAAVPAGVRKPLAAKDALLVGDVAMTFYNSPSFLHRLIDLAEGLPVPKRS